MTLLLKRQRCKLLCLLIFLLSLPLLASAQLDLDVQKIDMPKPFHRAYIQQLAQDDQGLIYFTTNQGIWRYDGTDVQPFTIPGVDLPDGNLIADLYCFDHYLFFCYRKDAHLIYCYDKETHKLAQYRVQNRFKYAVDPKAHRLYLFTVFGEGYAFDSKKGFQKKIDLRKYKGWDSKVTPEYYVFDNDGKLYLPLRNNIATVQGGVIKKGKGDSVLINGKYQDHPSFTREGTYVTDGYLNAGYFVAKYLAGFAIYDKKTLAKVYEHQNGDIRRHLFVCTFAQKDSIVIVCKSVPGGAKLDLPKGPFKQFTDVYPYSGLQRVWNSATAGNYFAASVEHLFSLTPSPRQVADTAFINAATKLLSNKSVRGIYGNNGQYYVGTYADMFAVSKTAVKRFPFLAYTIQPSGKDELMIGVEGGDGFGTLDTRTGQLRMMPNPERDYLGVTKLLKHGDGFLAGMRNRIYKVYKDPTGNWDRKIIVKDAGVDIIKDLAYIDDRLWAVGEFGVSVQTGKTFKKIPVDGELIFPVYAILPYKKSIFLATSGKGIIEIDHQGKQIRQIRLTEGLAGNFVYSLLEVDGLLFAGTNGGVSVFDIDQGMQPLPYPDDDQFEELYNQEFNHSAMFYDKSNRQVIMGGLQGVLFLSVDRYKAMRGNKTDKVILSYVRKEYDAVTPHPADLFAAYDDQITINPDEKLVALKLAGTFKQKDVLFRIREVSDQWRKNKLSEEISLYSLPPGTYTLQARFPLNTDPKYWLSKTIIVKPTFYQTWIFKVMILLIVALVVYQLWLSRVKKIRGEMELRTNIASDLHDEIGSTLTRISMRSELMYMQQETDGNTLYDISNDSKNAISSISDIIWSVDARNDSKEDLISRMQQHMHNMLDGVGDVKFETAGLEKQGNLPQLARQNIYLIFKEAINNIVRHNDKPDVWVKLDNQVTGMVVTIKNTIDQKPNPGYKGQGLKNMKMRAKRINAALTITNNDNCFLVTLKTKRW